MRAGIPITRQEYTADDLYELAKQCGSGKQAARARAIAMILEGASRAQAARSQGMQIQILRDWVMRYNEDGFDGLANRPRGGRTCRLRPEQIEIVGTWIKAGPDLEEDGVTRWRIKDLVRKIREVFGVAYSENGVRKLLRRADFRYMTARPVHPKTDFERQAEFVAEFWEQVRSKLGPEARERPIEIWFQDEGRIGQKGMTSRVWASKKHRPRVVRDHRYSYLYLFGAEVVPVFRTSR